MANSEQILENDHETGAVIDRAQRAIEAKDWDSAAERIVEAVYLIISELADQEAAKRFMDG